MALPKVLLVQLLQVRFMFAGNARPSGVEPVKTSCQLGVMPVPETMMPRYVSEFSMLISSNFVGGSTGGRCHELNRSIATISHDD